MSAPAGNVDQIQLGSGRLLIAPVGATEPTDVTAAWDAAWLELGFTKDGVHHKYAQTIADAFVEELLDPVAGIVTQRKASVAFNAAQLTALNLKRAFNGGTIVTAAGVSTFTPHGTGGEGYVAIGWESNANDERWVWRRCLNSAPTDIPRRTKTADYAVVGVEFTAYGVTGSQPFKTLLNSATRAA